jgi:hypothetical protein
MRKKVLSLYDEATDKITQTKEQRRRSKVEINEMKEKDNNRRRA